MVVEKVAALPLPRIRPLPKHVAIIMDGNGRWAERRGLSRREGHRAGARNIKTVLERLGEHCVPVLTLFAFSTENWGRPTAEVRTIMSIGREFVDRDLDELDESGVRVCHIGDPSGLSRALRRRMNDAVERTAKNDRIQLNIAFNYGGRADIVQAARRLVADGVAPEEVTEEAIASRLATAGVPDPDLLIRTGAEHRISNFLVWQAAYSEYYFFGGMWPDFGAPQIDAALVEFSKRRRRFGLVPGDAGAGG